jgi:hypothetical protein
MVLYWLLAKFVKRPLCVVVAVLNSQYNKCGLVKFLSVTPVGGINRTVAVEDQRFFLCVR